MGGNPLEQPHESPGKAATIPRALPPPHHPELHLLCLTRFRSNCPLKSARSCKIRFASVHEFYEEHGIGRRGGGERRDEKGMRVPRMSRTGFGSRGQGSVLGAGAGGVEGVDAQQTSSWKFRCALEAPATWPNTWAVHPAGWEDSPPAAYRTYFSSCLCREGPI